MTVAELIEQLQKMRPEAKVLVYAYRSNFYGPEEATQVNHGHGIVNDEPEWYVEITQ